MSSTKAATDIFEPAYAFDGADLAKRLGLYPFFHAISAQSGTRVTVEGREMLMASSNDYLGLAQDPRVKDAARQALDEFGTSVTGSRFLNGTLELHEELEAQLAEFFEVEAVLTFTAGFLGCLSVVSVLAGRHDILYLDRENHASLFDGTRLSFGILRRYRHGDIDHLASLLEEDADEVGGRLIVTDGVFSMNGQLARLPEIVEVAERFGARVIVDDAHAAGMMGPNGRGTGEHFGIAERIDVTVGTFSKAFASVGGFMTGERRIVDYVRHFARPFIFTAAPPASQVATTLKSLEVIRSEPWRRERLWRNVGMLLDGLDELGLDTLGSNGPIVPVRIGENETTARFWKKVWEAGIFVVPALPPSVPPGQGILRLAVSSAHTAEDLERIVETLGVVGREFGLATPAADRPGRS